MSLFKVIKLNLIMVFSGLWIQGDATPPRRGIEKAVVVDSPPPPKPPEPRSGSDILAAKQLGISIADAMLAQLKKQRIQAQIMNYPINNSPQI